MEHIWVKPSHQDEESNLSTIGDGAVEALSHTNQSPTKEILNDETKTYIEDRFPQNNEDLLQEDIAQKMVMDAGYLDELHKRSIEGENAQREIVDSLWGIYGDMMTAGAYIDIYKDVNAHVSKMIDALSILQLKSEISEMYPMAKSGISNKEAFALAKGEAERIKQELDMTIDTEISKESVGHILDKYKALRDHYEIVRHSIDPVDPYAN